MAEINQYALAIDAIIVFVGLATLFFQGYVSGMAAFHSTYGEEDALSSIVAGKTSDTNASGFCEEHWRNNSLVDGLGIGQMGYGEMEYHYSISLSLFVGSFFTLLYFTGRNVVAAQLPDASARDVGSSVLGDAGGTAVEVVVRVFELVYIFCYVGFIYLFLFYTTSSSCALAATDATKAAADESPSRDIARAAPLWNEIEGKELWNDTHLNMLIVAVFMGTVQFVHVMLLEFKLTRPFVVWRSVSE